MTDENTKDEQVLNINNVISDPFWFEKISILFEKNKLIEFFPTYQMTLVEKLNAITRLGIYLGLVLYFVTKKYLYLYIPIIVGAFTIFIFKTQRKNIELYFNSYDSELNRDNKKILKEKKCTKSSINNPFMNINIISDDPAKTVACDTWNNQEESKKVEDNFNYNLYRDVSDLYGKNNSQRQFYTMPSTTLPNDQTAFAKWCYSTGPTCKEKSINCTTRWGPSVLDTSNAHEFVPRTF